MVSLLHPCSYLAAIIAFLFVTLSLASGLLYIAELVEEHSRVAKSIGQRAIYIVIALHVLFYFSDALPLHLVLFGIFCHVVYLQNFSRTWPFISLSSIKFIASCLLVILDHFAWFFYFADRAKETSAANAPRHPRQPGYRPGGYGHGGGAGGKYAGVRELSFMDVATFFGVCVWLVPFFLFLSLSANDNVLPSLGEATPQIKTTSASDAGSPAMGSASPTFPLRINTAPPAARSSILKVALDPLLSLIPRIGGSRYRSSRSQRDGLIASPMTSAPPSPAIFGGQGLPSPNMFGGPSASGYGFGSPIVNGSANGGGYDANSLSPQTPFNTRFGAGASDPPLRGSTSTPQLRHPPQPKRSVTSPASAFAHAAATPPPPPPMSSQAQAQAQAQTYGFGNQQSPPRAGAYAETAAPDEGSLAASGIAIPRSSSPFAPPGGQAGGNGSGLVSRRKNVNQ